MKNGEWKMENGKETVADVVRQIGLCIIVGMACGLFDNRLDRIEERISDVERRIADNLQRLDVIKIGQPCQEPEPFHYVPPPAIEHRTYRVEVLDGTNVIWREGMEAIGEGGAE